jgi:hypothetical protein
MTHARTSIRQAFVRALKGKTAAGMNVFDSRLYSMEAGALPAIIIFSGSEEVITGTISPPRCQDRIVKITVECYAKAAAGANVVVDNLAMEVEGAIFRDPNLPKIYKDCKLESTNINLNSDGDQPVAVASLVFLVAYRTREDSPDTII